jgi:hypothetical protein
MTDNTLPWLSARDARLVREDGTPVLLRGFGLGGWLLPEGYMWRMHPAVDRPRRMEALIAGTCGRDWAEGFWERYRRSFITEADIQYVAAGDYNSVRLPFNSRILFRIENGQPVFNDEIINLVDSCLHWCKRAGIYLVLDMHGAPGGQTGANIDDSPADLPGLFTDEALQDQCVQMWALLAARYADEPAVAGYDLLNEPLAPPFADLAPRVLPLYRRIRDAIRAVDSRHMIILEGTRWASDLGIFEDLGPGGFDGNWMLQFHKYWNDPYEASILKYLQARDRLQVPLYMGEGGENNLDWYTAAFPMLESLDISWNFWTYKKMDCRNSPITFPRPQVWPPAPLAETSAPDRATSPAARNTPTGESPDPAGVLAARAQWDSFLEAIQTSSTRNSAVFRALNHLVPTALPAECFDQAVILHPRKPGALLRMDSLASILFQDGHQGQPDFQRMAGEDQPEDQRLCIELQAGETLEYRVIGSSQACRLLLSLKVVADCKLRILLNGQSVANFEADALAASIGEPAMVTTIPAEMTGHDSPGFRMAEAGTIDIPQGQHKLGIQVEQGTILLHRLVLEEKDKP